MKKVKISVAIDEELLEWAREQVRMMKFRSVSHVLDYALLKLKESEES